jgi:hypothetical protein
MYLTKFVALENISDLDWSEPACYPYIIYAEISDDVSGEVVDSVSWAMKYHFSRAEEFLALFSSNKECFQFLNDRLIDLGFNLGEPIEANKIRVHFIPRFAELFSTHVVSKEIEVQPLRENTIQEVTSFFKSSKKIAKGIKLAATTVLLGANIVIPFVSKIIKKD